MSYENIQFDLSHATARITLNRPAKLNSFTAQMHGELSDALECELMRELGRSHDYAEGVNAFLAKREPRFRGS